MTQRSCLSTFCTKFITLILLCGGMAGSAFAQTVTGLTLTPSTVVGGNPAVGTVTLSSAAPAGGAQVALSTTETYFASVPSSVTVPAGSTSSTFTVTTESYRQSIKSTITARLGTSSSSAILTALPEGIASLSFPHPTVGGQQGTGIVTLTNPAPVGGFSVYGYDTNDGYYSHGGCTIPYGATSGSFSFSTAWNSGPYTDNFTIYGGGTSATAQYTVIPDGIAGLSLSSQRVTGTDTLTGTVTLVYPPSPETLYWYVNLSSSSPECVVPSTVGVYGNNSSVSFTVKTLAHQSDEPITITASDSYTSATATFTLTAEGISTLSVSPSTVMSGQQSNGTVTLLHPAPREGYTVSLASSNPSAVFVTSSFTIPPGSSKGSFAIPTFSQPGSTSVTITATDSSTSLSGTLSESPGFWLAASPWPKFRGGLQNTGQGPGSGASGVQKWKFSTEGPVWSSPAIGADGTLYIGSDDRSLYAINANGSLKWKYTTQGPVRSSPAIGSDGTIYVGGGDSLYAIHSDGTLKWRFQTPAPIGTSSPTLWADGTVSIGTSSGLYEIKSDGTSRYHYPSGSYDIPGSPATDGNVLFAGVLSGVNRIFSFGPGSLNWSFQLPCSGSPAIGPDGTIYAGSAGLSTDALHGIFPTGKSSWLYDVDGSIESGAAVGADGTVFVASSTTLYAFDAGGNLKWSNAVAGSHGSSPTIGGKGNIYVGLAVGSKNNGLYGFNPDGKLAWIFPTSDLVFSSPAIRADGTLYFGCLDGNVYAVR